MKDVIDVYVFVKIVFLFLNERDVLFKFDLYEGML